MAQNENKLHGRAELIGYFKNGQIPDQAHFESLINSVIIQHDDGISKDEENGYIIATMGVSSRLITFYENIDRSGTFYFIEKDMLDKPSLKFRPSVTNNKTDEQEDTSFYFHQDGSLGIGHKNNENVKLNVNGFTASKGRIGAYDQKKAVPANGEWHDITEELDNCQAFEVIARSGIKGSGKFSMLHATALSTFGNSYSKIKKTRAYYGSFWSIWNKLNLRWVGTTHKFKLQLRSNSNFGPGVMIYYSLCNLWDDALFVPENCFYEKKNDNDAEIVKKQANKKT